MALADLTKEAVIEAIEEHDQIGRVAFLKKYGFRKARGYFLLKNEIRYDSKAIAGAAHGYLSGHDPLKSDEFSGGEDTVEKVLTKLGFYILNPDEQGLPLPGTILTNEDIGLYFAVGNMGGMRRSLKRKLLVLISDPFKGLYQDRWEKDILHYTGMGPQGDQSLAYAQNRTLAEANQNNVSVHLLEAYEEEKYTYIGEMNLVADPYQEEQLDNEKNIRKVWMFPIKLKDTAVLPVMTETQVRAIEKAHAVMAQRLSLEELKMRAEQAKGRPPVRTTQTVAYVRDAAVSEYAKRMANGVCDLCEIPAPFFNKQKEAYLECHHIVWLAQGGEDTIGNTVALCPNCHRKMHVLNLSGDRERLQIKASGR